MRDGIKSSSISLTLQGEPTEPTMWRRCVCKCMPIVAFAASTSLIDFTLRRNYPLNSSFSYPSKYEFFFLFSVFFCLNSPYIQENDDLCSLWTLGFICSMSFYTCTQSVTLEAITNHNNNFSYKLLLF